MSAGTMPVIALSLVSGQGDAMGYLAGQLDFLAIVAALIGGVIWAVVVVMRKPRPQLEDEDDEL